MKFLNTIRNLIRENEKATKRPQKHDANLQKNSTLYFQMGLIVCLLTAYGVLEMKFLNKTVEFPDEVAINLDERDIFVMPEVQIYQEPQEQKVVDRPQAKLIDVVLIDNDPSIEFPDIITPEVAPVETVVNPDALTVIDPSKDGGEDLVDFVAVEKVPVFPGCEMETTNEGRRNCFQTKMSDFINKKFNTNIASEYGLQGIQKIYVQFKVNKNGEIEEIKARAPHPALEKEADRVINKLPKMKPGMQRDQPVSVIYLQPIKFKVQ